MADEDSNNESVLCANPQCRVAESNRCVEGFELGACPYYGRRASDDTEEEEEESADEEVGAPSVQLLGAGTLIPAEASSILRQGPTRVIALLGPSDSGKTSLIACLYDLFQEGPVAGVEFARSRTLHAFEHACHDTRAESRRSTPHMSRTPLGEVSFYHLEVGYPAGERLVLLLGNRAGEEYRAAADDASVVAGFSEVARADTLTVLVDGERLLDAGARHNLRSDIVMMLQGVQDGGCLRNRTRLALVLTKLDAVSKSGDQGDRALRDFRTLLVDVRDLFGAGLAEVAPFQVAASPKTDALPRGTGVPDLLTFWLKPGARPRTAVAGGPTLGRAFARLRPSDESVEEVNG